MKVIAKSWESKNGNIERIYFNDENGKAFGYLETRRSQRGYDSYYDVHRHAKGDHVDYSYKMVFEDKEVEKKIIEKFGEKNIYGEIFVDPSFFIDYIAGYVLEFGKAKPTWNPGKSIEL